ncbi:MAG: protein-L-isoaspartate(D-aspartate) O-methyltransferase [Nitrospinota bacterium]
MRKNLLLLLIILAVPFISHVAANEEYSTPRERMIKEIETDMKSISGMLGKRTLDRQVIKVMSGVHRHEFVEPGLRSYAYLNRPLPIGYGQTISQPFIVALMTDLLKMDNDDVVLEIGAGSGYQAAVLAGIARKVYTIEIIKELGEKAKKRLQRLGYKNIEVLIADGYYGWKEHAPFDSIIVTAAAGHVPLPLLRQLKAGGRIVIPIGGVYDVQMLMVITKDLSGKMKTRQIIPVRFVPMTGKARETE